MGSLHSHSAASALAWPVSFAVDDTVNGDLDKTLCHSQVSAAFMDVSCIHTCLSHCKCFVGFAAEGTSSTALPTLKTREGKAQDADLPVFCVSAKDCQRLEGRTSKDGPPSAFTKLEHTEVPQLRVHIHHLTGKLVSLLLCCSSKLSKCMR